MQRATLDEIMAAREAKRPVAVVTDLQSGDQALVFPDAIAGALRLDDAALAAVREALRHDKSGTVETATGARFVQVLNPPKRLVLVGAVHIAQPLAPMARLSGYALTIIDPRGAFATSTRFPDVELRDQWPDDAMAALAPDGRTAVVTLTHDPKLDDPALTVALKSEAFYIGALGSRKTHAARLARLREAGFDDAALARIHGPIGLAIGAKSPAEIAVAILAQITQVLHGGAAA